MSEIRELRPARPDTDDDDRGYMPRLPWKWIIGLLAFVGLSVTVHQVREHKEADALRGAILGSYKGELAPAVKRYDALTKKVVALSVTAAQKGAPAAFADPRLNLDALHKGKGLYLRLRAEDAVNEERIRSASVEMPPDAIGKCLGLLPVHAGELLARGVFLTDSWMQRAHTADGVMPLRVVAEELRQRAERDLPFVSDALSAQWFLLVIERGENRRDAPVDTYLWDLREDQLLLSTRATSAGALIAARIAVNGVKPGAYSSGAQTGAARDCAIAAQMRAVAGTEAVTFGSKPPVPVP